jgi:GDP-4-dehydro-6-deoxy-D-mannose reductase
MRVLITGITGMIGTHFARAARERGWETCGVARDSAASRIAAVPDPSVIRCDVLDRDALRDVFSEMGPTLVIHLAAQAFNGTSWKLVESTHTANFYGTLNVLQCCRRACPEAKVLLACSSAEYGNVPPEECPLVEERLLRPISPYGVSKVATECLGFQYYSNYGLRVYLPRLFIHVGTGHPPATAVQNFARQLALIAKGRIPPVIRVGVLDTARDFIDVRDGVRGMMTLLEKGEPGVPVNICTGRAYRIGECLDMLIEIAGLKVRIEADPTLVRPSDEALLLGDNHKLRALGWEPEFTMRQTLEAVYADWFSRV